MLPFERLRIRYYDTPRLMLLSNVLLHTTSVKSGPEQGHIYYFDDIFCGLTERNIVECFYFR